MREGFEIADRRLLRLERTGRDPRALLLRVVAVWPIVSENID